MTNGLGIDAGGAVAARLTAACDEYLQACQTAFQALGKAAGGDGTALPMGFLGQWQTFARSLGIAAEAGGSHEAQLRSLAGVHGLFGLGPDSPALGMMREHQQITQRMFELGRRFNERYCELTRQAAEVSRQGMQDFHGSAAADPSLMSSPRRAYDEWIDRAEAAYAQWAHSEPFARMLGELCNNLSAFKVERGKLVEHFARQWDLPSRAEVDSLHREVRELRQQARERKPAAARRPAAGTATTPRRRGSHGPRGKI